ncbi:MAG: hypothetical protein GXO88_12375 [Chlorobi bacterium]|nr:hypothetical protein [Chlorobiota bacterium]
MPKSSSICLVFGFLIIAFNDSPLGQNEPFWFALAAGTMGGLIFSIFIIVVYLPIFVLGKNAPIVSVQHSRTQKFPESVIISRDTD